MAFTKHASLEDVEILDVHGSADQVRTASLDKMSDFDDFRTDSGYLYARIRAISSRVNKNYDGWPSVELAGGQGVFDKHRGDKTSAFTASVDKEAEYGYSTFLGKPIFVEHNNDDPGRARGVIVDSKLHVEDQKTAGRDDDPSHEPPTWVELLLEVDAKTFPKLAQAIIAGGKDKDTGIDGFSMGANVELTECSICKNAATQPDEFCEHVRNKGAHYDYTDPDTGVKTSKLAYENCFGNKFFEISAVFDPADETALSREVISSVTKEADLVEDTPRRKKKKDERKITVGCEDCEGRGYGKDLEDCESCEGKGSLGDSLNPGGDGSASPHKLDTGDFSIPPIDTKGLPKNLGKVANTDEPQSELLHVPEAVNTLRDEKVCSVCGSDMDGERCDVCGYIEPPEGFDTPDLTKAEGTEVNESPQEPQGLASNPPTTAQVKGDTSWKISMPSRIAETIVTPNKGPASDEPYEEVIVDPSKPTTSSVRTAADFIAAAGDTTRRTMSQRTADAASGAPDVAKPDTNVDSTGVGGVQDSSNPAASKADTQTTVEGVGGTSENAVESDDTISVDQGNEHSKNIEEIPTKTFGDGSSEVERQADPITGNPFPSSADGVKQAFLGDVGGALGDAAGWAGNAAQGVADSFMGDGSNQQVGHGTGAPGVAGGFGTNKPMPHGLAEVAPPGPSSDPNAPQVPTAAPALPEHGVGENAEPPMMNNALNSIGSWKIEALDSGAFPRTEDSAAGGGASSGTGPADPVGVAQDRVDLTDEVTSPGNNSGPTKTWSGTGGNGVTRQQDPTTNQTLEGEDGIKSAHVIQAFRLAEMEVDLGLLDKSQKFARVGQLEQGSSESLAVAMHYVERVKTAGLSKHTPKTASRMPSMTRSASTESSQPSKVIADEALFTR